MLDLSEAAPRGLVALAATLALTLVLAGCGGDEAGDAGDVGDAPATTTSAVTESSAATTSEADGGASRGGEAVDDPPELAGTEWDVQMLYSAEFGMTNVWPDTEVSLSFGTDGTLSGFSGCNDFTGSYELVGDYLERDPLNDIPEGQGIVIADLPEPAGGCDPNADEQEVDVLNALETAAVWQIDAEGELTLIGPQGLHIGADPTG